jgi:hypothetical protein
MSIPPTDYQILVKQSFQCIGVTDYICPIRMRVFDRSGYYITNAKAYCSSCFAVYKQLTGSVPFEATVKANASIQARQRIVHFLSVSGWTVGNGDYIMSFKDFWGEFYRWSEKERMYTNKVLVRSIITELCETPHDATHIPISLITV